jgi:hypothetical protein
VHGKLQLHHSVTVQAMPFSVNPGTTPTCVCTNVCVNGTGAIGDSAVDFTGTVVVLVVVAIAVVVDVSIMSCATAVFDDVGGNVILASVMMS